MRDEVVACIYAILASLEQRLQEVEQDIKFMNADIQSIFVEIENMPGEGNGGG